MPFNPSAPVEELELPSGAVGGFDPSKSVDEMEVPSGAPGAFDPSKPFEVDASTVHNPKEVADGIADAIGDTLAFHGIPKPLSKILLSAGGRKTDMAINTLFPMAGSAIGTAAAPGVGTAAGGAAGGAAGEGIVELRQIIRGERQNFSPGSLVGTAAVSAFVPKPLQAAGGSLLKTAGRTLLQRGKEGAVLGAAQEAIREVIDDGKLSVDGIAENALWGSAFGAAFGGLETAVPAVFKAIKGKPANEAATVLREDGSPQAVAVAEQIDANLASGKVELPPPPETAPAAIEPGPETIKLASTPDGAQSLEEIKTALADPKTEIRYSIWPDEYLAPGQAAWHRQVAHFLTSLELMRQRLPRRFRREVTPSMR